MILIRCFTTSAKNMFSPDTFRASSLSFFSSQSVHLHISLLCCFFKSFVFFSVPFVCLDSRPGGPPCLFDEVFSCRRVPACPVPSISPHLFQILLFLCARNKGSPAETQPNECGGNEAVDSEREANKDFSRFLEAKQ